MRGVSASRCPNRDIYFFLRSFFYNMADHAARGWCITWNNPPEELQAHGEDVEGWLTDKVGDNLSYAVWQLEEGELGTRHFQMYVELNQKKRFAQLRQLLPGLHLEKRRGSRVDARNYCMKEDSRVAGPWEFVFLADADWEYDASSSDLEDAIINLNEQHLGTESSWVWNLNMINQ